MVFQTMNEQGTIDTSYARIMEATSTEGALAIQSLRDDVLALASSDSGKLFFMRKERIGGSGILSNADGSGTSKLFSSVLSGWSVSWAGSRVLLAQQPSDGISGSAYLYDMKGSRTPVAEGVTGLTVAHTAASTSVYVYGSAENGAYLLYARGAKGDIVSLRAHTVADKCIVASERDAYCAVPVQTPSKNYLEGRAEGTEHTSDALWHVNLISGEAAMIASPEDDFGTALDVRDMTINSDMTYLSFINDLDGTPWVFRITP